MKKIQKTVVAFMIFLALNGCDKPCDLSLRIGEIVQIPIQFNGFSISEIDKIVVYRIDKADTNQIDTFLLTDILWANNARSTIEMITDTKPNKAKGNFGNYDSYFHNCNLIFDWFTGKDTLSNFDINKSKENINGCHESDPNVKIDKLTFEHKGKIIAKNESIQINK